MLRDLSYNTITVVDTSVLLLCSVTCSPSGLPIFQPILVKDGCCHWSTGLTSQLIVKMYDIGVCGIQWPIWLESTLFTVRIKLCFHTSYLGSFLNKAWYYRVTMMSLLELLSLMKYHNTLEPRKHHITFYRLLGKVHHAQQKLRTPKYLPFYFMRQLALLSCKSYLVGFAVLNSERSM